MASTSMYSKDKRYYQGDSVETLTLPKRINLRTTPPQKTRLQYARLGFVECN